MFELSRRDLVLGAAGAAVAFGLDGPVAFIGAASAQSADLAFFKYKLGDIEITSLSDGIAEVPHRQGWIKDVSVDETKAALRAGGLSDAYVPLPFTAIAVKLGDRLVLIDSGTGGSPLYGPKAGGLLKNMVAAGLDPKSVTTVLISHLHGDHIYGLMENGTNAQVFPEAEIIIPATELKWWTQPGVETIDLGPSRKGLALRIQATLAKWKNVRTIEPDTEVLPGVRSIAAYGHSPGQLVYALSSGKKQLWVTADVSLLPALFVKHPDWQGNLDQDGSMAVETRKRIFEQAIAEGAIVAGTHWILPNIGAIVRDGGSYAFAAVR